MIFHGSYFRKIADDENLKKKIADETMLKIKFEHIISCITSAANEGKYYITVAVSYSDCTDFLKLFCSENNFKLYDTDWTEISEDNLYSYYPFESVKHAAPFYHQLAQRINA